MSTPITSTLQFNALICCLPNLFQLITFKLCLFSQRWSQVIELHSDFLVDFHLETDSDDVNNNNDNDDDDNK